MRKYRCLWRTDPQSQSFSIFVLEIPCPRLTRRCCRSPTRCFAPRSGWPWCRMACATPSASFPIPACALNITGLAKQLDETGYRPGKLWAPAISLTQLVGGPLLALGLFTRPVATVVLIFLLVSNVERWRVGVVGGAQKALPGLGCHRRTNWRFRAGEDILGAQGSCIARSLKRVRRVVSWRVIPAQTSLVPAGLFHCNGLMNNGLSRSQVAGTVTALAAGAAPSRKPANPTSDIH